MKNIEERVDRFKKIIKKWIWQKKLKNMMRTILMA